MGVEYFIVKPSKQEVFYLGKHIQAIDCMNNFHADYIKVDNFNEFFLEVIESNDGFLGDEYTYKDIKNFAYLLYEWCYNDPVYLSSDASPYYNTFKDYKETGSIIDFCTKHPCHKVILNDLIDHIPSHYVYTFEDGTIDYERSLERLL